MELLDELYTDIFTEPDDSVFSDGSIDPMGLRIIWTSLGNAIFANKLNTISTDIRLYTLNLFHHDLIYDFEKEHKPLINNLISKKPYHNKTDLYDGIIIFLESLLAQVVYRLNEKGTENISVPGISKLTNIIQENPESDKARLLIVSREEGVLIRHILLGIHGRHKGPFRQMQIFGPNDYYANKKVWNDASSVFTHDNCWRHLKKRLSEILQNYVFENEKRLNGYIYAEAAEVINNDLELAFAEVLKPEVFRAHKLLEFWEERLGLNSGAAGLLYEVLKKAKDKEQYEEIIKEAAQKGKEEDNKYIKAIVAIEPFIARVEKITHRLMNRGLSNAGDIQDFIEQALNDTKIDFDKVQKYLSTDYFNKEALRRIEKLFSIYKNAKEKDDPITFVRQLIEYHKKLMESRGNLPWISIGTNNEITQHRSLNFSKQYLQSLQDDKWINNYYLSTVLKLYKGLYQE